MQKRMHIPILLLTLVVVWVPLTGCSQAPAPESKPDPTVAEIPPDPVETAPTSSEPTSGSEADVLPVVEPPATAISSAPQQEPAAASPVDEPPAPPPIKGTERVSKPVSFSVKDSLTTPSAATEWPSWEGEEAIKSEDMRPFARDFNTFSYSSAAKLFSLGGSAGTNTLYSPASLYMGLAMLSECTAGDTRGEVLSALGMGSYTNLGGYSDRMFRWFYEDESPAEVFMSNSIWIDKTQVDPTEALMTTLQDDYHAHAFAVDFKDPKTGDIYTGYINNATRGMLGGEAPPESSACILLNTLYFESSWQSPFSTDLTHADTFNKADGGKVTASFMVKDILDSYAEGPGFQRTSLGFVDSYRMHLVLPTGGSTPEALLADPAFYEKVMGGEAELAQIHLELPKFDFKVKHDMIETQFVQGLGIKKALLWEMADFSPLRGDKLYVDKVIQEIAVSVDENGCKAAAYTEINIATGGGPDMNQIKKVDMVLDRPFIFVITGSYGMPIFVGIVNEPAAA